MSNTVLNLPSPVHTVEFAPGFYVDIKRDDLINEVISGNKWRKLKYHIQSAKNNNYDTILTFGGAYSNLLPAAALGCRLFGLNAIAIVRGEHVDLNNPTLKFSIENGMQIVKMSKTEFLHRNEEDFIAKLKNRYPNAYIVPEGGAGFDGVKGAMEILNEVDKEYDIITCTVGTGATAAGLYLSKPKTTELYCFNVFKNTNNIFPLLKQQINCVQKESLFDNLIINNDYGFNGFAKINSELVAFVKNFFDRTGIQLDYVYNGKMFFGLTQMIKNNEIKTNKKILIYHCGGVQGNDGFVNRGLIK